MGLSPFSKCSCVCTPYIPTAPDYSKRIYQIERIYKAHGYTLVQVKYKGATNYDGRKLLLYKGKLPSILDPHFCEHHESPVARFEPTELGWGLACSIIANK